MGRPPCTIEGCTSRHDARGRHVAPLARPRDALEFCTLQLPPCGCTIEGAGTLPDPVRILFCAAHQATQAPPAAGAPAPAAAMTPRAGALLLGQSVERRLIWSELFGFEPPPGLTQQELIAEIRRRSPLGLEGPSPFEAGREEERNQIWRDLFGTKPASLLTREELITEARRRGLEPGNE